MEINIRAECLSWDWKESVDVGKLNDALLKVYDGTHCPRVRTVTTGSDSYGMIVSNTGITDDVAEIAWKQYWYEDDD